MEQIICWLKGIWWSAEGWPFGFKVSGHVFKTLEEHENCKVFISECEDCGKIDISWTSKENKYR